MFLKAIGLVIFNRVKAGWWNGDWLKVIADHERTASHLRTKPMEYGDPREPMMQKLLWSVDLIQDGRELDTTCGALYYAKLDDNLTDWFKTNIMAKPDQHRRVAQVGRRSFFL